MIQLHVKYITILSLLFASLASYSQENDCALKKNSDGILVYTCKSDNERFKSLKAEFTIRNTTVGELVAFMRNVTNYPSWQYNMVKAEILKHESEDVLITRSEIDAPWPVENRELIVQYALVQNPQQDQLHVTTKTVPYHYPENPDLVRVPFSHAEWFVHEVNHSLNVTYIMRIDPGGSVPAWLVNIAMAEGPYQSFVNLKKQLEK
jgi:hypothetical protein